MGITITCMVFAIIMTFYVVYAPDPAPLQDFCVGIDDTEFDVKVNGLFCKNPKDVTSEDFLFRGFNTVGNTSTPFGRLAVMVNVTRFRALNTMGLSIARIDYAPGGINPLHLHPRSSEALYVLEGTLYAGFITSNDPSGANRLFSNVLKPGDIYVFPQGLTHFQLNIGRKPAVANAVFGSQNPGLVTVPRAIFGSATPPIPDEVLQKSFRIDATVVQALRSPWFSDEVQGLNNNNKSLEFS